MLEGTISKQVVIEAIAELLCKVGTAETVDKGQCSTCKHFETELSEYPCKCCKHSYASFYERSEHGQTS